MYLGTNGISSSSAGYLANLAGEVIRGKVEKLENLSFLNKEVELISGEKKLLRKGETSVNQLRDLLIEIGNLTSFVAWVREAIKKKEALLKIVAEMSDDRYEALTGNIRPTFNKEFEPVSEEDIKKTFSDKEMCNYLMLESLASTVGKYIHPGGSISNARRELLIKTQSPTTVAGEGRDLLIYTYTPSIEVEEVEKVYQQLQSLHREYEKKLNSMKFDVKSEANKTNIDINAAKKEALADYSVKLQKWLSDKKNYITEESARVSSLKIIIPEKLQGTWKYLESLGKCEE